MTSSRLLSFTKFQSAAALSPIDTQLSTVGRHLGVALSIPESRDCTREPTRKFENVIFTIAIVCFFVFTKR